MDNKEFKDMFESLKKEIMDVMEKQAQDIAANGSTTAQTQAEIKAAKEHADKIEKQLEEMQRVMKRPDMGGQRAKSLGAQFVETKNIGIGTSVEMIGSFHRKATTDSYNTNIAPADRVPGVFTDPAHRSLHIRDIMNVGQTSSSSVEFVCDHGAFTNAAASQWNSGASPARIDGGAKAESTQTLEVKSAPVVTIAHFIPASRQVLADAPMLRSYIDGQLAYGIQLTEDAQILNGAGTNGTLTGIMNTVGIGNVGERATSAVTQLDHIRAAILLARLSEYPVDGILLNPTDLAAIETLKDDNKNYILANVVEAGVAKLWRVPVIETTAITAGTFLVGNFALGATLWERESVNVRIGEQHASYFTTNLVAILGEERVALTVHRPHAFAKGSFEVAST